MLGGLQTGVYAILVTILSIFVLQQKISVYSILGIFLIGIGTIFLFIRGLSAYLTILKPFPS